tara:strand:+ start:2766 stop:3383 length:618 start_codon:yes stop_codon:yes gene_type:complete
MKRIVLIIIILLNINKSSAQGGVFGELLGLIIVEEISSSLYKTYEKSKHRIELSKTFNNYRFYGNLIDSTSIDSIIANNLEVGIEVDAYFLLENNKKNIPKLSIMAVDTSQNLVFIYSRYIKKITRVEEERIDKQTSGVRYIDRAILYEQGLSKDIIASKNEDLYRKREKAKKRNEFMNSREGGMLMGCVGVGLFLLAAMIQSPW